MWKQLPWWLSGKESACQCRRCKFNHWVGKIPWRREWQPTPVLLPEESHRQRSLEGYSRSGAMLSNLVGRMTRVATEHLKCHGRRWRIEFFKKLKKKIIFDLAGSSLPRTGFPLCGKRGLRSGCTAWASHCGDFSCCRSQAPGVWASVVVA